MQLAGKLAVVTVLLMVAVPVVAGEAESPESWRPMAATALLSGEWVTVSWVPGDEVGESYRVYGVHDESMTLLATIEAGLSAEVPAGFGGYAVTAIKSGAESPPQMAMNVSAPCVTIDHTPPRIAVGCTKPGEWDIHFDLEPLPNIVTLA